MDFAINLDDDMPFSRIEISDIEALLIHVRNKDRMLAEELDAQKSSIPNGIPEEHFTLGLLFPKLSAKSLGFFNEFFVHTASFPNSSPAIKIGGQASSFSKTIEKGMGQRSQAGNVQ